MPIVAPGTVMSQAIQFNTGYMDINGYRIATLQDITINVGFTLKEIRALGTIKMVVAPKRIDWKPGAKFKAKSVSQQFIGFLFGSSSPDSTGYDYNIVDGQVVLSTMNITAFTNDDTTKSMQFQFINAVIGSASVNYKLGDAAEFDLDVMAQDLQLVTNYSGF